MTAQPPDSLAVILGRNCKRIRTTIGATQNELARLARIVGPRWTSSAVGDFEAGRSAPTFATVLAVTLALQMAEADAAQRRDEPLGRGVRLDDLVSGDGLAALTDTAAHVPLALLQALCRGEPFVEPGKTLLSAVMDNVNATLERKAQLLHRSGSTEDRLARRLGIDKGKLAGLSYILWQSTFSEERDRRAGPDANQQKRGRVSRELRAELEKALSDGNH